MKKIVPWVKSNLLIVLCLVITLIAVPVMIFFSAGMNKELRKRLNDDVSQVTRDLSNISVSYDIPSLDPSEPPTSVRAVPNDVTTEAVAARLEELAALSGLAHEQVVERNSAGKAPLVAGLFPTPANESARVQLTSEMVRAWPEAHRKLLERSHAGSPPDPATVLRALENQRQREIDKIEQNRAEEITPEELDAVQQDLIEARLDFYRSKAKSASFYADMSAFAKLAEIPSPDNLPRIDEYQRLFWDWQQAYWIHEDIIAAIQLANTGRQGWLPIPDAPVKRLLRITLGPAPGEEVKTGSLAETLERDFKVSPTGRAGGNPLYDRRTARVEMIVDAASINTVLSAFANTNFMGVISMNATWYPGAADLRQGFDYGDRDLVRLELDLETVWIRSWLEPLMPPDVKKIMGLATEENAGNADGGF